MARTSPGGAGAYRAEGVDEPEAAGETSENMPWASRRVGRKVSNLAFNRGGRDERTIRRRASAEGVEVEVSSMMNCTTVSVMSHIDNQ